MDANKEEKKVEKKVEKVEEKVEKVGEEIEGSELHDAVRRLVLAGIGAVSIFHEELGKHIDKFVERGESVEKNRDAMMQKMRERREKYLGKGFGSRRFTEALEQHQAPIKVDISNLNKKVSSLEKKVDELTKSKA